MAGNDDVDRVWEDIDRASVCSGEISLPFGLREPAARLDRASTGRARSPSALQVVNIHKERFTYCSIVHRGTRRMDKLCLNAYLNLAVQNAPAAPAERTWRLQLSESIDVTAAKVRSV
jgi:hypothetical protein